MTYYFLKIYFINFFQSVKAARRKINIIVMSSRFKQRPTHFISIPMNDTVVMKNFETFKVCSLLNVFMNQSYGNVLKKYIFFTTGESS